MTNTAFWKGRRVFITGHTGFVGGWLSTWLLEMGAHLTGYALEPSTQPSYFELTQLGQRMESAIGDVRNYEMLCRILQDAKPEVVFHLAAQPIVRRSYREPLETFSINVMGTANLLEAVRQSPSVRAVVAITSDKCYENREWLWAYREDEPMGGRDPYSASKGCAELVVSAYRRSFFEATSSKPAIATVRAGNIFGGGDWAEDRIVPDAIKALHQGNKLIVRNPAAMRPWQHVLEPITGYLMLAERLHRQDRQWTGAWNFGPLEDDGVTVAELAGNLVGHWGCGGWTAMSTDGAPHEAHYLKLDSSKARWLLGWRPRLGLDESVALTVDWYRAALSDSASDMYDVSCRQIRHYETKAVQAAGAVAKASV